MSIPLDMLADSPTSTARKREYRLLARVGMNVRDGDQNRADAYLAELNRHYEEYPFLRIYPSDFI